MLPSKIKIQTKWAGHYKNRLNHSYVFYLRKTTQQNIFTRIIIHESMASSREKKWILLSYSCLSVIILEVIASSTSNYSEEITVMALTNRKQTHKWQPNICWLYSPFGILFFSVNLTQELGCHWFKHNGRLLLHQQAVIETNALFLDVQRNIV